MDNYNITRKIGNGSFGRVFQAIHTTKKTDFAIKKVCCSAPENVELALQEFRTLSKLPEHINIIRFEECFLQHIEGVKTLSHGDKNSTPYLSLVEMAIKGKRSVKQTQAFLWFVMEYCDSGDLNEFLLDREVNADLNGLCMLQLAEGVAFLHKNSVVHRDLKPENVLVHSFVPDNAGPLLKIADFGLSKVCSRASCNEDQNENSRNGEISNIDTCWLSSACGSDFFMAPEVFEGHYTAKADVFAMGVIFWSLMDRITFIDAETKKLLLGTYVKKGNLVLPVGEVLLDNPKLELLNLLKESGTTLHSNRRGTKTKKMHTCVSANVKQLRNLVVEMLNPNPELRPNSHQLLLKLRKVVKPSKGKLEVAMKKKILSPTESRAALCEKNFEKAVCENKVRKNVTPVAHVVKTKMDANSLEKKENNLNLCTKNLKPLKTKKTKTLKDKIIKQIKTRSASEDKKILSVQNTDHDAVIKDKFEHYRKVSENTVLHDIKNCEQTDKPYRIKEPNPMQKETLELNDSKSWNKRVTGLRKFAAESKTKTILDNNENTKEKDISTVLNQDFVMPLSPNGRRRHNGLKAQICMHKNPVSRVQGRLSPRKEVSQEAVDKVEVPRNPCVVSVSKVKHHPVLPMKKRWRKYVLHESLNDGPSETSPKSQSFFPESPDSNSRMCTDLLQSTRGSSGTMLHPKANRSHLSNLPFEHNSADASSPAQATAMKSSKPQKRKNQAIDNQNTIKKRIPDPPPLIHMHDMKQPAIENKMLTRAERARKTTKQFQGPHFHDSSVGTSNTVSYNIPPPQEIYVTHKRNSNGLSPFKYDHVILPSQGLVPLSHPTFYPNPQYLASTMLPSNIYNMGLSPPQYHKDQAMHILSAIIPNAGLSTPDRNFHPLSYPHESPPLPLDINISPRHYLTPSPLRTPTY